MISRPFFILWNGIWQIPYLGYRKKYNIDPGFRFNGAGIKFYGEGKIICKKNSYISRFSSIQSAEGCAVEIGENTAISNLVRIYTGNRISNQDFSKGKHIKRGNVKIGDNCWIGSGVFINKGNTIGDNVVVGANSVVTKDIPSFSVAGGNPARVIKNIDK